MMILATATAIIKGADHILLGIVGMVVAAVTPPPVAAVRPSNNIISAALQLQTLLLRQILPRHLKKHLSFCARLRSLRRIWL